MDTEGSGNTGRRLRSVPRAVADFLLRSLPPAALTIALAVLGFLALPGTTVGLGTTGPMDAIEAGRIENPGFSRVGRSAGDRAATDAPPSSACFEPLFRDDFSGDVLDGAWTVYSGRGSHSIYGVRLPEAVSVEDGKLVITAANDGDGVAASGGLRLELPQTYGRYALRIRTDEDPANATSGVVLTWPVSERNGRDGQNLIYQTPADDGDRAPFYSVIHKPFVDEGVDLSRTAFVHTGDASQWQELAMEWTPEYVEISWIDPITGQRHGKRLSETARDLITDAEHVLAIQLDLFKSALVAGDEVRMEIDWVDVQAYCGG
ncbi:MAG: glycoside hydrolase family 16 protein [Actinomycetota bacterium]